MSELQKGLTQRKRTKAHKQLKTEGNEKILEA